MFFNTDLTYNLSSRILFLAFIKVFLCYSYAVVGRGCAVGGPRGALARVRAVGPQARVPKTVV